MERSEIFEQRKQVFEAAEKKYAKKYAFLSHARTIVFLSLLVFVVFFANERNGEAVAAVLGIFGTLFFITVKRHNRIAFQRDFKGYLKNINREEMLRLRFDLDGFDRGDDFVDKDHPYAVDLDVFGHSSLFQLVNRTVTSSGREKLAGYMKKKSSVELIRAQQEVVRELMDQIEWRQEFQASGMFFKTRQELPEGMAEWAGAASEVKGIRTYSVISHIMRFVAVGAIAAALTGNIEWVWVLIPVFINVLLLLKFARSTQNVYQQTGKSYLILKGYDALIRKAETAGFKSKRWQHLTAEFHAGDKSASSRIGRLGKALEGFDARNGMIYHVLNPVLLLDLYWLFKIERWKTENGRFIFCWFDAVGEIETIASISGFAFAHPDYVFPKIHNLPHRLQAREMGHPLIKPGKRVANEFGFMVERQITLVTGSNMSGKSTFLRTVGINTVMALMGAPVCAREFEISDYDLFTSMRTQDNLVENLSSFYAELTRIKQLLDLLKGGEPVLFMLDELLKGTNSRDRHKGAVALIRQLSRTNASGFISTHDLELSHLENEIEQVKNYSFESELAGDELVFDYKLRRGATESYNASILMEKIGIRMHE